jgi:O-antigen/teichoic acid export membrane protein
MGLPLVIGGVFSSVLDSVGVIVLQALLHDIELVGLYSYAYQLGTSLHFLVEPVSLALLPIATRLIQRRDIPGAQRILRIGIKLVFLLLPILVLIALFSQETLLIIYGSDFVAASPLLVVLLLGSLPLSLYYLFSRALLARGRSLLVGGLIVISALLNAILAVFLVLIAGGLGAATASTLTFSLMALLSYLAMRRFKELRVAPPRSSWSGPLIISCSTIGAYFAISLFASVFTVPYLTWLRACLVIVCLIVSTILVKPLSAEEFLVLRKSISQGIPGRLGRLIVRVLSILAKADHAS